MDDTAVMKGIRISTVVVRWRVIHYDLIVFQCNSAERDEVAAGGLLL